MSESSIEFQVESDQTEQRNFSITNDMEDSLEWHLSIRNKIEEDDAMKKYMPSFQNKPIYTDTTTKEISRFLQEADADEHISVIVEFETDALRRTGGAMAKTADEQQSLNEVRQEIINRVDAYNPENIKEYKFLPILALQVNRAGLEELLRHPQVKRVVEDKVEDVELETSVPLIGTDNAWEMGYSGGGQTIVILDTGIDGDHSFFSDRVVEEYCYSTNNSSRNVESLCPDGTGEQSGPGAAEACDEDNSSCGHGSHVTGIAAGKGENFSGVAPEANIIAMQVFSRFNDADDCDNDAPCFKTFRSDQISALEKVFELKEDHSIASVNMSLGGGEYSDYCPDDLRSPIVDQLTKENIVTVTSSGNSGYSQAVSAPACVPSIISVGSTETGEGDTKKDEIAGSSNGSWMLDLLAPGTPIYSSDSEGSFERRNGTSMASPHVAGAWAVYKSNDPDATVNETLNKMQMAGEKILDERNSMRFSRLQIDESFETEYWLSSDKFYGTLAPGQSEEVELTFQSNDLEPGTYRGEMTVTGAHQDIAMDRVSAVMEVIPEGELETVWPGDTNNDEEVSSEDLLRVGLCYGEEHDGELNPGDSWREYQRQLWNEEAPFCLFADADGNGRVNAQDVEVIDQNYGNVVPSKADTNNEEKQANGEINLDWNPLGFEEPAKGEILLLLNSEKPIYGMSLTVEYEFPEERPSQWDFEDIDFQNSAFETEVISLKKHRNTVREVDVAFSGTDQQNEIESGELMRLPVITEDDYEGEVRMHIKRIQAINSNGSSVELEAGGLEEIILPEVQEVELEQNFPNPFNSETTIRFGLPEAKDVTLEIFDVTGRKVQVLVDEQRADGWHKVHFDPSGLASGIYFYRLSTNDFSETQKMTYIK